MTVARLIRNLLLAWLALVAAAAAADNFSPAFLQLTERNATTYDVRWKTPAKDERNVMPIRPIFPDGTQYLEPLATSYSGGTAVMLGRIAVPGGLEGKRVEFQGLTAGRGEVLVRFIRSDSSEELSRVTAGEPQLIVAEEPDSVGISLRYAGLGVEHILFGFDHLLFVAGLFMLVANIRTLVWTVTSFTLAHSLTLALVTLDVISVPRPPVEAFIALSIVFVAVEVIRQRDGKPGLASNRPWIVAFTFGLLHGLGFASALAEIGLPQNHIPLALLFFNVGVEIGQTLFVAALLALTEVARRLAAPAQLFAARLASCYGIGGLASYWLIDRVVAFA